MGAVVEDGAPAVRTGVAAQSAGDYRKPRGAAVAVVVNAPSGDTRVAADGAIKHHDERCALRGIADVVDGTREVGGKVAVDGAVEHPGSRDAFNPAVVKAAAEVGR